MNSLDELACLKPMLFTVLAGENMARRRKPVFLMVDTCVWQDLAKDYSQQPLLRQRSEGGSFVAQIAFPALPPGPTTLATG